MFLYLDFETIRARRHTASFSAAPRVEITTYVAMANINSGLRNGDCEAARQTSDITISANINSNHGLQRKHLLWQTAVRNIIDQHNMYSLRLAGGLERGRHRITVTDAYIADINRYTV